MSHLLLIVEPPGQREERTPEEGEAAYAAMTAFGERIKAKGQLVLMQSLTRAQTRVRVAPDGGSTWIDGPFAEAKEIVGGFFLLKDCSRDEAMAWAADCPAAAWATVEVRELGPCFT
jgi:hypothetical protein